MMKVRVGPFRPLNGERFWLERISPSAPSTKLHDMRPACEGGGRTQRSNQSATARVVVVHQIQLGDPGLGKVDLSGFETETWCPPATGSFLRGI